MVEEARIAMEKATFDIDDTHALVALESSKQCTFCKRKGHTKENCYRKKKMNKNRYTQETNVF